MPVNVSTNNLRVSTNEPDALPWINLLTTETAKFRPARLFGFGVVSLVSNPFS